jgi:hypothetical protein
MTKQKAIALVDQMVRSVIAILRQLTRQTPRKAPFQHKRDGNGDENEWPYPTRVDIDEVHFREQENDTSDQEQRASDNTVKRAIPKPVGEAADGHSEKARSGG